MNEVVHGSCACSRGRVPRRPVRWLTLGLGLHLLRLKAIALDLAVSESFADLEAGSGHGVGPAVEVDVLAPGRARAHPQLICLSSITMLELR